MTIRMIAAGAAALAAGSALAGLYGDTPDGKHAWAVHDWNRPKPTKVTPADEIGKPPSDAVVLFDGTKESFEKNWQCTDGTATQWKWSEEGYFYTVPGWRSICTKKQFGDCQLHIEYRHDAKKSIVGHDPQMRGNSGVFLMGAQNGYEIQVLESYTTSAEMVGKEGYVDNYADGMAGSVYAENPPMVNPARKMGEWQVYDIVFHQPVWDGLRLVHPGSVTVFFNGVLVQDHWEMEGLTTHRERRPLAPHDTVGPLTLQDHGCEVQYRNIWYRPLASRWDNLTHSTLTADENEVMALRRKTAAKLFAKIKDVKSVDSKTLCALAEVISYCNEGKYKDAFKECLDNYRKLSDKQGLDAVNNALTILNRNRVLRVELVK